MVYLKLIQLPQCGVEWTPEFFREEARGKKEDDHHQYKNQREGLAYAGSDLVRLEPGNHYFKIVEFAIYFSPRVKLAKLIPFVVHSLIYNGVGVAVRTRRLDVGKPEIEVGVLECWLRYPAAVPDLIEDSH